MNRKHAETENLSFTAFLSHTHLYTARNDVVFTVHLKKSWLKIDENYSGTESIHFYCLPSHRSVINGTMSANKTKQSNESMSASCLTVASAMEIIFHLPGKEKQFFF